LGGTDPAAAERTHGAAVSVRRGTTRDTRSGPVSAPAGF
jgi:hypothetical protein